MSPGTRYTLGLALLFAAVLGSWYLDKLSPEDKPPVTAQGKKRSYYMKDATLLGIGENGRPLYEVRAVHVQHQPEDDSVGLRDIEVDFEPIGENPWSLTADTGWIPSDRKFIDLSGKVVASRFAEEGEPLHIRTGGVRFNPGTRVAATEEPVLIVMGNNMVTAIGLEAHFMEDRLHLKSKVHGRFVP